jgi:hypothetical protein
MKTVTVLVVPPDYQPSDRSDPRIDYIEEDETIERPKLVERNEPEEGSTSVDRGLISDESKQIIADEYRAYTSAKNAGDQPGQIDSLEKIVDDLCHILTGDDLANTATNFPEDTTESS